MGTPNAIEFNSNQLLLLNIFPGCFSLCISLYLKVAEFAKLDRYKMSPAMGLSSHLLLSVFRKTLRVQLTLMLGLMLFVFQPTASGASLCNTDPEVTVDSDLKLGLTLSGGDARGMAHIGVLHAIDNLGIKVDYITGTGTGAIIGAMYASGYSAFQIEKLVHKIHWKELFSPEVDLDFVHPSRRKQSGSHILSIPFEDNNLRFESGVVKGQHLWEELTAIFFHVSYIRDFDQLPIPFACVATDLKTGQALVLRSGNLIASIRASMSVPAVFSGLKIDGGVANDFPVKTAIDMGADQVLGVNVSGDKRSSRKLRNPTDATLRLGYFSDEKSLSDTRENTRWIIDIPLSDIEENDYGKILQIIELGKKAARENIDVFEEIAESQSHRESSRNQFNPERESHILRSIEFRGLESTSSGSAEKAFFLREGEKVTGRGISSAIQVLYKTGMFESVYAYADSKEGEYTDLVVEVREKSSVKIGAFLGYTDPLGVWVGGSIQVDNPIWKNSYLEGRLQIGENPAILARKRFFLDPDRNNWITADLEGSNIKFPYEGHSRPMEYRQTLVKAFVEYSNRRDPDSYFSLGVGRRMQRLSPRNSADVNINGWSSGWVGRVKWERYTLNRHAFPTEGQDLSFSYSYHFGQRNNLKVKMEGVENPDLQDLGISAVNHEEFRARWLEYVPLSHKYSANFLIEFAMLFSQHLFLKYNIGGYQPVLDRQMTLLGLREYQFMDNNYLTGKVGIQRTLGDRFFVSAMMQVGSFGFGILPWEWPHRDYILGWGISLGFLSRIGPVETTFSYSPELGRVIGYVNFAWSF